MVLSVELKLSGWFTLNVLNVVFETICCVPGMRSTYDGAVMFAEPRFWLLVRFVRVSVNVCVVGVLHVFVGLACRV
jgi:hypothetical protein